MSTRIIIASDPVLPSPRCDAVGMSNAAAEAAAIDAHRAAFRKAVLKTEASALDGGAMDETSRLKGAKLLSEAEATRIMSTLREASGTHANVDDDDDEFNTCLQHPSDDWCAAYPHATCASMRGTAHPCVRHLTLPCS